VERIEHGRRPREVAKGSAGLGERMKDAGKARED
jgi:hypothetical protein